MGDKIHRSDLCFPCAPLSTPVSCYQVFRLFFQSSVHHHLRPWRPAFPPHATSLRTISER
jgi:hypothetical protein